MLYLFYHQECITLFFYRTKYTIVCSLLEYIVNYSILQLYPTEYTEQLYISRNVYPSCCMHNLLRLRTCSFLTEPLHLFRCIFEMSASSRESCMMMVHVGRLTQPNERLALPTILPCILLFSSYTIYHVYLTYIRHQMT